MPSMMMLSDSMFPRFTDESSQSEKIEVIHNYLYQLLEQLRYTLGNLEADNFNESALESLGSDITAELEGEVKVIRHALVGLNGTLDLAMTGDGILTRLQSAEGSVANITATAAVLETRLENAEGGISLVSQTASDIETRVESLETAAGGVEGDISTLKAFYSEFVQTAHEIDIRVASVEGNIDGIEEAAVEASVAAIEAMAEEISLSVTNSGTSSRITLTAFGTTVTSGNIQFSGVVTVNSLEDEGDTTIINGAEITTGIINSVDIHGSALYLYYGHDTYDNSSIHFMWDSVTIAKMEMGYNANAAAGNSKVYLQIQTKNNAALKLKGDKDISIEAGGTIYFGGTVNFNNATVIGL